MIEVRGGLTAVFEQHGDDYIAHVEEMPDVNAIGGTIDEARANLANALELIIEVRRELASEEQKGRIVIKEEICMQEL
jgi:predicted RNase H-like HicB family nuclease